MRKLILVKLITVVLMSCNFSGIPKNLQDINGNWTAVRIANAPIDKTAVVPKLEIKTAENKISGTDGCNHYFGSISKLTHQFIVFSEVGSTHKMCPDMALPDRYLQAIAKVSEYTLENKLLVFRDKSKREILAFRKED